MFAAALQLARVCDRFSVLRVLRVQLSKGTKGSPQDYLREVVDSDVHATIGNSQAAETTYLAKWLLHNDSHKATFANFDIRAILFDTFCYLWVH